MATLADLRFAVAKGANIRRLTPHLLANAP